MVFLSSEGPPIFIQRIPVNIRSQLKTSRRCSKWFSYPQRCVTSNKHAHCTSSAGKIKTLKHMHFFKIILVQ